MLREHDGEYLPHVIDGGRDAEAQADAPGDDREVGLVSHGASVTWE